MNPLAEIDPAVLVEGRRDALPIDAAATLATHPLEGIETEYPHYVGSVESPEGPPRPSAQHPAFYGCFDWHSAVHGHWALVRGLRLFPDHPDEAAIVEGIDRRLTDRNVAEEVAHFEANPSFEEPYGWSWLLRLAAELHLWDDPRADAWRETLRPLEAWIRDATRESLLEVERPQRVGTHGNTAFALAGVLDYARTVGDEVLATETAATARRLYVDDTAAVTGAEPVGWDFVSPALMEADLLRRVLAPDVFARWLDGFIPDRSVPPHDSLLAPISAEPDDGDGMAMHLVGLDLSRAWCLAGIAESLRAARGSAPDGDAPSVADRLVGPLSTAAEEHVMAAADRTFTDEYAGSHWLSSFALYLLTRNEGGIAPSA